MKKGYCPIDGMVYTNNFPGRCALPAETFLIFKRNLWFLENIMFLFHQYVHWFSFIFKWFMKRVIAISKARYIRTTFPAGVHFRRKHFSYLKEIGPMGPRGLGPNPFSTVSPCPPGVFFREKTRPEPKKNGIYWQMKYFCRFLIFWPMLT